MREKISQVFFSIFLEEQIIGLLKGWIKFEENLSIFRTEVDGKIKSVEKKRPYCPWRSRPPECVKPDCCLAGLSSTIACSSELGPRLIWRSVWLRISTKCQGLQQWNSLSGKGEHFMDFQGVFWTTSLKLHWENQALCAPMLGTQLRT